MNFIHTSDIHLASKLTSKLPSAKASARRKELTESFFRLTDEAMKRGCAAVIIAGDLFDTEKITEKELDSLFAIIERADNLAFIYLEGNHEKSVISSFGKALPENLYIFGEGWTYYKIGDVTVAGRSETSPDMFSTLKLDPGSKNIVVLHGELRDHSQTGGIIGLNDAAGKNIDYLALGHYHTYRTYPIDKRGYAVYSGAPEGRGFDEAGELGYVLISEKAIGFEHKFIPFAKRKLLSVDVDVTGAKSTHEIEEKTTAALGDIGSENLVRANLVGAKDIEARCDKDFLTQRFSEKFYYFEIKDRSKITARPEDYRFDKSLKGEFIRLCLADERLSDDMREKVIRCGISALLGEAFDE